MRLTNRLLRWAKRVNASRPPDLVIGDAKFLERWYIIPRNPVFNVYLHRWNGSDDDRALHDHPWISYSWSLGPHVLIEVGEEGRRTIYPGNRVFRWPKFAHRIVATITPTYTLFVTGPRIRTWGFWCPKGWRDFREFHNKGCD